MDCHQKIFPLLYLRYSGIGSGRKKSFIIHSFAHSPVILVFEWDNYVPNYPNYLTCHKKMVTFFPLCNRNEWNCRGWSFYCTCYSANFVGLFCDRNCPFFSNFSCRTSFSFVLKSRQKSGLKVHML